MEYYLVMLPQNSDLKNASFRNATARQFKLPNFKVGSLDTLMEASDELAKMDNLNESSIIKIIQTGEQVRIDGDEKKASNKAKKQEFLTVNVLERGGGPGTQPTERSKEIHSYLENWKWDEFKYTDASDVPIKKILEGLQRPILMAEELIKKRVTEYSDLKLRTAAAKKKVSRNLTVKDISQDVNAWNAGRKKPLPVSLLRRKGKDCGEGASLIILFACINVKEEQDWRDNYHLYGITPEAREEMFRIEDGQTNHQSDGVSFSNISFRNRLNEISTEGVTVSNPGGDPEHRTGAGNVLDGSMETQFYDKNGGSLIFDFGKPECFDEFRISTSKDFSRRDPVQWTIHGQLPGSSSWILVASQTTDYNTPTERRTWTPYIPVKSPGQYHKYRFTPTLMRGSPERGPIPCGNGAVPGTSEVVTRYEEHVLYSVMVFSQMEESYRAELRDRKIIIREYEPQEDTGGKRRNPQAEYQALEEKRIEKRDSLLREIKTHFSEAFTAWIHMKAVRAFVEAILRYGLPSKYHSYLFFCPNNKAVDEMRSTVLKQLEKGLSDLKPHGFDLGEEASDQNALQEHFPYVSLKIKNFDE